MWWLWPLYAVLLMAVVFLSTQLAKFVDLLEKRTKLSGAFLGGVLLAGVTSLPELCTTISSILLMDEPSMAFSNILGSNLFDIAALGFLLAFTFRLIKKNGVTKSNGIFIGGLLIVDVLIAVYMFSGVNLTIPYVNINALTLVCIAAYVVCILSTREKEEMNNEGVVESKSNLSTKAIVWLFVAFALLLIGVSLGITFVVEAIANTYGLNKGFAGAVFLGVGTSLPEIVSTFALLRYGNINAAMGDMTGSAMFNFLVLSISDVLYFGGTVFVSDMAAKYVVLFGIAVTMLIGMVYIVKRKNIQKLNNGVFYIIVGVLSIGLYITYLLLTASL